MDISGFLFLYQPLSAGWFGSPWVQHYVSLTGTLLSYSLSPRASESPMTPCTRVSVEVSDRSHLSHVLQCIVHSSNTASLTDQCHWVLHFMGLQQPIWMPAAVVCNLRDARHAWRLCILSWRSHVCAQLPS